MIKHMSKQLLWHVVYHMEVLGFEYDFDKCIKSLDIVYNSHKREVNR